MKKITSFLFFLMAAFGLHGQSNDSTLEQNLFIMARSYGDSIVLRWAPSTPNGWVLSNQSGYVIERLGYMRPEDFDPGQYLRLNNEPVKPWPLEDWAAIGRKEMNNPMVAVAAQCIYGKTFSFGKKGRKGKSSAGFMQQANEIANRWTFALMAADLSAITATAAGLRFVDTEIQPGQTYVYRIYSLVPVEKYEIDTAYVVINPEEQVDIPVPVIAHAQELENQIQIEWDRSTHESAFTAFYIERSENNGASFERLTELPFASPPSQDSVLRTNMITYLDSVPQNYFPYQYRITGITPFGELSKPSEPIGAMGRDRTPPPAPKNLKAASLGGSTIQITWEMEDQPSDMKGFFIGRSDQALGNFQPLFDQPLLPQTRSYTDETADPQKANYYVVASSDSAGNGMVSMAVYGMIIDSIPPASPVGLEGKVDTNGVVTLRWNLGPEPDIIGYQVYYANAEDHVFAQITHKPHRDTVYQDTIMVKTLTEQVFYKVVAVDANYNYSPFSEMLELKRPDLIPPTPPIFSNYKVGEGFIRVEWIPSSSRDVEQHLLFRRESGSEWEMMFSQFGEMENLVFTDSLIQPGKTYEYSIMAIDDDGNSSPDAYPLILKAIDFALKPPVRNLTASFDEEKNIVAISWVYPYAGRFRYTVYRAVNGGNFITYATRTDQTDITDNQVNPGEVYEYSVKVTYVNGKQSGFSPLAKIVVE